MITYKFISDDVIQLVDENEGHKNGKILTLIHSEKTMQHKTNSDVGYSLIFEDVEIESIGGINSEALLMTLCDDSLEEQIRFLDVVISSYGSFVSSWYIA